MAENQNSTATVHTQRSFSLRAALTAAMFLFLPPLLLFGAAGTINWPTGWIYIALTLGGVVLSRVLVARVHPDLLTERETSRNAANVPPWDLKIAPLITTVIPMALLLVAGLDKRFGWSPIVGIWPILGGTLLIIAALAFATWAMVTNRYFSAFVRLQDDRGQQVVATGPYAIIRHPGYAAGILTDLGVPLMLTSWWTFIPALIGVGIIFLRTALEDRYLHTQLPGYREYSRQVRHRIVPFIW